MDKIKSNKKNNYIYIIISVVGFALLFIMIFSWIKRGTYSLDTDTIDIVCPTGVANDIEDKTIECDISLNLSSEKVLAVNLNYDFAETVEYVSFEFADICSTTECEEGLANTENGFAIGSLNGFTTNTTIGKLKVKLPANTNIGDTYKIGLKNIELTYNTENIPTPIDNVSTNVQITDDINDSPEITLFDDSLIIDGENKIVERLAEGTKYSELKTKINSAASVTIKSNDDATITDNNVVKTGDQITITLNNKSDTYILSVLGDLTGDGEIKINDVSRLYRLKKGRITITDKAQLAAGDIVIDDEIKINDISRLYRYKKGRITSLEVVE